MKLDMLPALRADLCSTLHGPLFAESSPQRAPGALANLGYEISDQTVGNILGGRTLPSGSGSRRPARLQFAPAVADTSQLVTLRRAKKSA
jgi:hypothetical protein